MLWSTLLHFYQPHSQQPDILLRIVNECYRPVLKGFLSSKKGKMIVNINGALTTQLAECGYSDVVDMFKELAAQGKIEFTGSAMYHAMLPLLSEEEIKRQIELNTTINKKYFGELFNPKGFFPPEMAVNDKVLKVVRELGYEWVAAPELSFEGGEAQMTKLYKDSKTNLNVFFRNKRLSILILSAVVRTKEDLLRETQDARPENGYWFTVMDAETFGHHRIGHERFLLDCVASDELETTFATDLCKKELETDRISLRPSTWSNQEQDFWLDNEQKQRTSDKSFILWKNPENPIHVSQWLFVDFVLDTLYNYPDKNENKWLVARDLMDKALASDQFWWASATPWWSLEMVEQGAYALKEVCNVLYENNALANDILIKSETYYRKIIDQAFDWQRTGYIRKKHLDNSGTFMKDPFNKRAPAEWYNQIILELEDQMNKSAQMQDFEKAIKWRDAIVKLKLGTDIYDVLHVVDELWTARNIPSVKPFLSHSWEEFSKFAKDNFREVPTKEEFEKWQKVRSS